MTAPIIVPSSATAGVARSAYRAAIGRGLGAFQLVSVAATATSYEADRQIVVGELEDDEETTALFAGGWVYVRDGDQAGQVRRILPLGYDGPLGSLLVARPFAAPLEAGTSLELSWPLPPADSLGGRLGQSLNTFVNLALGRCKIATYASFTGNGTREYDLSPYAYISSEIFVDVLRDSVGLAVTDPDAVGPYGAEVVTDGVERTLVTEYTYGTAETFRARIIRRGDTFKKSGGVWAATTGGLSADTDEGAAPEHWVAAFGVALAAPAARLAIARLEHLSGAEKAAQIDDLERKRKQATRDANGYCRDEFPLPLRRQRTAPLVTGIITDAPVGIWRNWP